MVSRLEDPPNHPVYPIDLDMRILPGLAVFVNSKIF